MAKKLELWEKELPPDKVALITYAANEGIKAEMDRINELTQMILDSCYVAAISDNLDLSLIDIKKIVVEANAYMDEVKEYINKNRGEYFMKVQDDKLMEKIRKEIIEHIENGDLKSESINTLKKKYKITPNVLNDIWLEEKEKFPKLAVNKHAPQPTQNQPILEQKKASNVIAPEKENKSAEKQIDKQKQDVKSIFEVVEKKLKFKGEFYDYEKDKSGLKVGAEFFKSLEEIEAFRIRETEEFENMVEEIRQAFAYEG
ncbi:hypothetical protein ACUH7Y_09475 [Clostridium beijerinckii]|uniref:Uncharacterized protein n=1 Tax=Clostridium beijerinckii TaxID=1520 RepID=A0A7X9SMQ6_CLOBE|nr:hypothetical protein [Clostridium beijerinckii]NMF04542.1 hypothetical protein [Clostridium beijerinckii]